MAERSKAVASRTTIFGCTGSNPVGNTISAPLAQSVEHQTFNLRVVGSSPTRGYVVGSDIK